jgi:hypothetical protein
MAKYEKRPFTDQSLVIDGSEYIGCRFERCEIIFAGGSLPTLVGNDFKECTYKFDGPAARTVQFMTGLYSGGAQQLIEATFEMIRGKPVTGVKLN